MSTLTDRYATEFLQALAHQIRLRSRGHHIAVSCTCLCSRGGRSRQLIEMRKVFPATDALAAWRAWHQERGVKLP